MRVAIVLVAISLAVLAVAASSPNPGTINMQLKHHRTCCSCHCMVIIDQCCFTRGGPYSVSYNISATGEDGHVTFQSEYRQYAPATNQVNLHHSSLYLMPSLVCILMYVNDIDICRVSLVIY